MPNARSLVGLVRWVNCLNVKSNMDAITAVTEFMNLLARFAFSEENGTRPVHLQSCIIECKEIPPICQNAGVLLPVRLSPSQQSDLPSTSFVSQAGLMCLHLPSCHVSAWVLVLLQLP